MKGRERMGEMIGSVSGWIDDAHGWGSFLNAIQHTPTCFEPLWLPNYLLSL